VSGGECWWAGQDSNLQPDRYERPALTIELPARPGAPREGKAQNARGGNEISHGPAGRARAHPFKAAESLMRTRIAERSFQFWFRMALAEDRPVFYLPLR
jgi:hypothetical protein